MRFGVWLVTCVVFHMIVIYFLVEKCTTLALTQPVVSKTPQNWLHKASNSLSTLKAAEGYKEAHLQSGTNAVI